MWIIGVNIALQSHQDICLKLGYKNMMIKNTLTKLKKIIKMLTLWRLKMSHKVKPQNKRKRARVTSDEEDDDAKRCHKI